MRERRLIVAYAVDNRHLAVLEHPLKAHHRLLEAELVVDLKQFVFAQAKLGTRVVIGVVAKRHDRVEPVIAARELDDNQDAIIRSRLLLGHF